MSTHGRGASRLLLGSVADKVLRSSRVPVLLYRPIEVRTTALTLDEAEVVRQLPSLMRIERGGRGERRDPYPSLSRCRTWTPRVTATSMRFDECGIVFVVTTPAAPAR